MSHEISISKENSPKSLDDKDCMSKVPYASVIGSIMYAMVCTLLDCLVCFEHDEQYKSLIQVKVIGW